MKSMSRFKNTFQAIGVLIAVFALYQFALAQDISSDVSNQTTEVNPKTPEVLGEIVEKTPVQEPTEVVEIEDIEQNNIEVTQEEIIEELLDISVEPQNNILNNIFVDDTEISSEDLSVVSKEFLEDESLDITTIKNIIEEDSWFFPVKTVKTIPSNIEDYPKPLVLVDSKSKQSQEKLAHEEYNYSDVFETVSCSQDDILKISMDYRQNLNITIQTIKPGMDIQIGSLPYGFEFFFSDNFEKKINTIESSTSITIKKNKNAQKGNFIIPVIYTNAEDLENEKTFICQINLSNR